MRLFNNDQAVYHEDQSVYHVDQSVYQEDQAVYYEGEDEYPLEQPAAETHTAEVEQKTEHYWASDNFGQFNYQEEQSQYEEEQPYDY